MGLLEKSALPKEPLNPIAFADFVNGFRVPEGRPQLLVILVLRAIMSMMFCARGECYASVLLVIISWQGLRLFDRSPYLYRSPSISA
jgi:hypothetical protein